MALSASKGFAHVTVVGVDGHKATLRLALKDTAFATIATNLADYLTAVGKLATVTGGKIVSLYIGTEYTDSGLGASGAFVEDQAVISAKLATAGKYAVLRLPAPVDGVFKGSAGDDYDTVDTADSDMVAWLDEFYASGAGHFKTSDGEQIANPATVGNWKGRRLFRHSRRRAH
jgi:hypothetical protein